MSGVSEFGQGEPVSGGVVWVLECGRLCVRLWAVRGGLRVVGGKGG